MISVNALINDCFQKCSLIGDGQSCNGTQAMNGLKDLQSVIAELNSNNLVLSDVEVADVTKAEKIKIMEELPKGWKDNVNPIGTYGSPDLMVIRYEGKIYAWEQEIPGDPSSLHWVERNDIVWPDLLISPLPDRVQNLSRKLGERYVGLVPADKALLDSKTKFGLPVFYTTETAMESVKVGITNFVYEVFNIEIDSIQNLQYRITYLKGIPQYKLNDKLYFPERILTLLEDGVCAKLCLRYKLIDIKPFFDEEYANGKQLLKRINNNNRPMLYTDIQGGSYQDSYYNGFAPRGW